MIAAAAVDPDTGDLHEENGSSVVPAASTIKLFVASAFWRSELDPRELVEAGSVQRGGDSLVDGFSARARLTLADLALLMLSVSDNSATNLLLERLGLDAVNAEIARLGLSATVVRRPMLTPGEENVTCATDLARGLAALADDERIVSALARSQHSNIPALLGDSVRVSSKSGQLPSVRHEVALLEEGQRRLAIAVCSSPPASPDELASRAVRLWRMPNIGLTPR